MDMETLAYPLRVFINFYIALMNAILFRSFMTPKPKFRGIILFLATFGICIVSLLVTLLLYHHFVIKLVVACMILSLGTGLFYKTPFPNRILISFLFFLLLILSEGSTAALSALFHGISMPMNTDNAAMMAQLFPLLIFSYTVCFGLPSLIAWQYPKNYSSINLTQFLALPLSQIVATVAFLYALYMSERSFGAKDAVITVAVIVLCVVTDLVFLRTINDLVKKKRLEEQRELQKRHYAALLEQQRSIRKLRHDIANHLMTMHLLVDEESPKAKEYVRDLSEKFQQISTAGHCENQIADAVLFGKAAEASSMGVRFSVSATLSEGIPVDDLDLMSILSNLLDNALTAAKNTVDKFVSVSIREEAGTVVIKVRNSFDENTTPDLHRTTKPDRYTHGLGIGIIEGICQKYDGSFLTNVHAGIFEASAMLLLASAPVK